MRRDDFRAAWRISDAALAARDPTTRDDPALPYHLRWVWDGSPLAGRDVLVRCYHGLGDTIQFARYLGPLRAVAARVTLEVQPELLPLLCDAADRVAAFDVARPLPPAEVDVEIMELAHALRLRPEGLASGIVRPAPIQTNAVALCWQAGGWDPARSVPLRDLLATLCGGRHPHPGPSPRGRGGRPLSLWERAGVRVVPTHPALSACTDAPPPASTAPPP